MGIFQHGHYVHLKHQVAGLSAGYLVEVERSVSIPDLNVLGTMDGLDSTDAVDEWKSINARGFSSVRQFGPKREHLYQVHAYMYADNRTATRIVYENKDNQEMQEFLVQFDEKYSNKNISDWQQLNNHMEDGTTAPMLSLIHI